MIHHPPRLLHEILSQSAMRRSDHTAVVVEGKRYTYAELIQSALRLASALQQRGLNRGDRVAIYMDNTWSCVISVFGVLMAGGVFFVINPQTKSEKLEFILKDSDACILLTDGHLATVFLPILANVTTLKAVISSGVLPADQADYSPQIEEFTEVLRAHTLDPGPAPVIPLDLAALIYTSGSTGNPKGVMQTHQAMLFTVGSLIEYLRLSEEHRILNVLPMAFDYGIYQLFMAVALGATLVLERSFTYPAQILNRVEEQAVTVFPGVPTIFSMLLSAHARKPLCYQSVQRVTNTAAALPSSFHGKLREIFPNALIYKMYGLTECKRVSYLEPELLDTKPDSVGRAIPGTEIYLLSPDGLPVKSNENGILYVRGPHVMAGYWNRREQSEHMLKSGRLPGERVLCTHDWFKMDDEGYLYFVGRSDDIIKTRGEKVSPVEVENVLHGIDGILEAAVVGVPDPLLGQAIRAYVVLDDGKELTDREIMKQCLVHLENFMVPKDVVILKELPKTATGKISKKGLGELEQS